MAWPASRPPYEARRLITSLKLSLPIPGCFGVLKVGGKEVASKKIPHTVPALFTLDETFDVGVDTRTSVDDNDYKVPFRFPDFIAL